MDVDLRTLYSLRKLDIDETVNIPTSYYQSLDIKEVKPLVVKGQIFINSADEIELTASISGTFVMPCAVTLEAVDYNFSTDIDEIITLPAENNELNLALLPVLWENTVLEVPIRVVKAGIKTDNIKGEGWTLESDS